MIVARSVWGAKPASLPPTPMRLPATEVFIHHSVTPVTDMPYADMRAIEAVGMQRFGQFSYSYAIHPKDGMILEGAGLRRGAHTSQRNSTAFGIVWVGNYDERNPTIQQVESTRWLIAQLQQQGHLIPGADIKGHRDTGFATACPGAKLYRLLDAIRIPWEEPMAGDPNRADVNAPCVGAMAAYNENGDIKGYILVGADYGCFAFGEGVRVLGNVEYNPPSGREWLPKA